MAETRASNRKTERRPPAPQGQCSKQTDRNEMHRMLTSVGLQSFGAVSHTEGDSSKNKLKSSPITQYIESIFHSKIPMELDAHLSLDIGTIYLSLHCSTPAIHCSIKTHKIYHKVNRPSNPLSGGKEDNKTRHKGDQEVGTIELEV